MVGLIRYFSIVMLLGSCIEQPDELPEINAFRTETELSLIKTWEYQHIDVSDSRYTLANSRMELGSDRNRLGGNRADIRKRRIVYYDNGTYQLKWIERGDYSLGTDGDPNWQPNFGSWELHGNRLIHNKGHYYETEYTVSITDDSFSRTSIRYMSEQLIGARWEIGDEIQQTEVFRRTAKE